MKRLAFALVALAIGLAVSPARADYALVRFEDGWCRDLVGTLAARPGASAGPRSRSGCPIGSRPRPS